MYVSSVTSASSCSFINSSTYLYRTTSLISRILQGNNGEFLVLLSLKRLITRANRTKSQEYLTGQSHKNIFFVYQGFLHSH